jgi:TATA-box binding protein (TBP) (component of TFIID and TFIIIB)
MRLTNIKISLKCEELSLDSVQDFCVKSNYNLKVYSNFLVVRKKFVYSIFKKSLLTNLHHVNVTNIKSFKDIGEVLESLESFGLTPLKNTVKIDNLSGLIITEKNIKLPDLVRTIKENSEKNFSHFDFVLSYNNEVFPGLFLKVFIKEPNRKIGTAIIFHSGKIILVGSKNLEDIECLSKIILAQLSMK